MSTRTRLVLGSALVAAGVAATLVFAPFRVHVDSRRADAAPPTTAATGQPPAPPLVDARALSRTFVQVAEQLKPSVVAIFVEKGGGPSSLRPGPRRGRPDRRPNPFEGTPFEHFFGFGEPGHEPRQTGAGSGVVIDGRGYILTNNHVVDGADKIRVKFADGSDAKAAIKGTDPKTDLAVIKVEKSGLVAARFGDSDRLQPGEWVVAIGNPFGLDHTVTVGVISAKGRSGVGDGPYEDFLQTDAAINPGNSGGPLVSLDGEVVGINTAIKGIGTMIGFAIPTSMARPIADQLIHDGSVKRPYLGILMQDLTAELAASLGGGAPAKGALVGQVQGDSPAAKAGLLPGDVITRLDSQPVDGSKAVQRAVLKKRIGEAVQLSIWRGGKELTLRALAAPHPGDAGKRESTDEDDGPAERGKLGLQLETLSPPVGERLGLEPTVRGAVITDVREGGAAAEAGLREGDVIVEVDRRRVSNAEEAIRSLKAPRPGGHLLLVRRGDAAVFVPLPSL